MRQLSAFGATACSLKGEIVLRWSFYELKNIKKEPGCLVFRQLCGNFAVNFSSSMMKRGLRRKLLMALMAGVVAGVAGCATQQERARRRAQLQQAIEQAVGRRQLHIDITSMNTLRYGSRIVTPDFFVELRGDTLNSYLPYLGQAYQAPYGSPSQGLNFKQRAERIVQSEPKPHLTCFNIYVRTREDYYHYRLEVYSTGKAFVHVQSQHRDPVSYDGNVATE